VTLDGVKHLPTGPALLVGNHGLLGYESPLFFERLLAACGRLPIGLADRWFFEVPGVRDLLVRLGGTYGCLANGLRALRRGDLVVCYPGGAREVLKHERDKYRLLWQKSVGFVRLALAAKVPIIPFAAAGVDDTFRVVSHLRGSGEWLMGHGKYDLPVVWGERGPLPNPVPFWFRFGEPIVAPEGATADDDVVVRDIHHQVWSRTQTMLDGLVAEWTDLKSAPKRAA
jgi:1-acyl-sn-glycerol-3-phosphate acyltransferase